LASKWEAHPCFGYDNGLEWEILEIVTKFRTITRIQLRVAVVSYRVV